MGKEKRGPEMSFCTGLHLFADNGPSNREQQQGNGVGFPANKLVVDTAVKSPKQAITLLV